MALIAIAAAPEAAPLSADVELTLEGALFRNDGHAATPTQDVVMLVACDRGRWFELFDARAPQFNYAAHNGRIALAEKIGDKTRLTIEYGVGRDDWYAGGKANYVVEFAPSGDRLIGSFTGMFNGTAVKGRAVGVLRRLAHRSIPPVGDVRTATQPAGFIPGRGVPVMDWDSTHLSGHWLFAGPFPFPEQGREWSPATPSLPPDLLASIGGCEKASPQIGMRIVYRDIVRTFEVLPDDFVNKRWDGLPSFDVAGPVDYAPNNIVYFYCIVHNDQPRLIHASIDRWNTRMWLGGEGVREGDFIRLGVGMIPVLIEARLGERRRLPEPSWAALRLPKSAEGYANWERQRIVRGELYAPTTKPAK